MERKVGVTYQPELSEDAKNGNHDKTTRKARTKNKTEENNNEVELRMAFKALDKDRDGVLSKSEMRVGMKELWPNMTDRVFDAMFEEADKDGDGVLSFTGHLPVSPFDCRGYFDQQEECICVVSPYRFDVCQRKYGHGERKFTVNFQDDHEKIFQFSPTCQD